MKRGKDEGKIMGPMFPRLHVNDTEKGGPRAPPRNKMALYEQLSIPSQRFSDSVPNQGDAIERGAFFSYRLPIRHQLEKICSQYSDFSSPLMPVGQRKVLPSHPSDANRVLKFHKFKRKDMLESSTRHEGKSQTGKNLKEFAPDQTKAISNSSMIEKHIDSSICREPTDCPANSIDIIETHDTIETELRADSENDGCRCTTPVLAKSFAALYERSNAPSLRASLSGDYDLGNDTGSRKRSARSVPMRNLERADSESEISVVESIAKLDMTPDDVVGTIGQKHFWKARKAILNQQRVFAVQVFELHRLVKVQRLIAASPQFLVENSASVNKPNALAGTKTPLASPITAIQDVSKRKGVPEKPNQNKESSAENTAEKASFSSIENGILPSGCRPLMGNSPAPSLSSNPNAAPRRFNQAQGHQWLIPVMTPSEGLVYKPYPGPGFVGPACGGCGPPRPNPAMGNFLPSAYGIPTPHPHYQLPSFSPATPHGYFPTYGMPMMNVAAMSGSSVEQTNPQPVPSQASAGGASANSQHRNHSSTPCQKNRAVPAATNSLHTSKDTVIAEASRASSPVERLLDSRGSNDIERANVLSLFPMAPSSDAPLSSPARPKPDRPAQVIKVVPHNARSATESAARIFRSIQEERKQYDSV